MIYHWCPERDWASSGGGYFPAGFAADGFTHCSFVDQITATATSLYGGASDLVLLCIEEGELPVVVEDCYEIGEPYPHVYGPIPRRAVTTALPFPCLADGSFALPEDLPDAAPAYPELVRQVVAFEQSSLAEVGHLLARLVGAAAAGRVLELGTGTGHAAAWMAGALRPDQELLTVEIDQARAAAAGRLLSTVPRATVLEASWEVVLESGPFALVFVDAAEPKRVAAAQVVAATAPGGVIVLDDLTPRHRLNPAALAADEVRRTWLWDTGLEAAERQVSQDQSVIVARRV